MLKNVFLTGGTGCLGRYIIDEILTKTNLQVIE